MPRQVDREQRRRLIAEAVLRLTATRGLGGVSLRDVATEAAVSMGMVQHYFASKDQMLLFACEYLVERTNERIRERVIALPQPVPPRVMLRTIFEEMLPLDTERSSGIRVWFAFLARAVVEPELEVFMRATWTNSHAFIAQQFERGQQQCELALGIEPETEAVRALGLVDGLVPHVLLGHYTGVQALNAIDSYLDQIFAASEPAKS